jgi:hypothetical protein
MDWDRRTRIGARAPGVERQKPFERGCFSAPRPPAQNGDQTRAAGSTKDEGKPIDVRAASHGQALSDTPALKPYWGEPAVRNLREGNGNVGIMRSPLRAIALPDPLLIRIAAVPLRLAERTFRFLDYIGDPLSQIAYLN